MFRVLVAPVSFRAIDDRRSGHLRSPVFRFLPFEMEGEVPESLSVVLSYTSASNRGATVKLLKLSPRVGDVLKSTRLIGVFDIFDDEAEAIASFG